MNGLGEFLFIVIICALCGAAIGVGVGQRMEKQVQHDAAVKSGHAEYYLDEKNERQWRWK